MSNQKEHLLDILISDYYRVCEINNLVPILIEYKVETKGSFSELKLSINRRPVGLFCYMSIDACKDSVVQSYFIKGIEVYGQQ